MSYRANSFENITLSKDDKAICQQHQEDLSLVYLNKGLFGVYNVRAGCSKCAPPQNFNRSFLATFHASSANQCCAISQSVSQISSVRSTQTVKNPSLNFDHHVVEYELWDMNSNGYELKSLVYMKDLRVLAACSKNGSVCFWSIGEKVEPKETKINLEKKINFAKYHVVSEDKKYLAIGTDKGVHVYHIAAGDISSIRLLGVIEEEKTVSDLDFLENEGQIVTVYNESIAKIWSLKTLEMEKAVDLHQHGIKGEIHTVMYMKRTSELAIEHEKGLSVIKDWQQKDGNVRHHFVAHKDSFGCLYLANLGRFILNNGAQDVQILNDEDFAEVQKFPTPRPFYGVKRNFPKKFSAFQDGYEIISNVSDSYLGLYTTSGFREHYLSHSIWGVSELEMIEDQYRIAKASSESGIVTIFRTNANTNIERGEGEPPLPAIASNERIIPQNSISGGALGGSLFSGTSSGGGLFSGSTRSKNAGLFSSKPNKKSIRAKPKKVLKPVKKGKKIQKIQVRSVAAAKKKKEKVAPSSVKKGKKEKALKAESSKSQNKNMMEAVRIRGKKKTKEERVWVVLPSAAHDDDERKRGRSLEKKKKTPKDQENKSSKKGKRKTDLSKDKGSRSRSKSKSITRK